MKTKLLLFTMACAFAVQTSAQSETVKYEDFLVTPSNISQGVLDNGFRYYLCDNGFTGNGLEIRLIQKSGTGDDEGTSGIALLLRRMLFSENLTVGSVGVVKDQLDALNMQRIPSFRALNGLIPDIPAYCSEMDNGCTEFNLFRLKKERAYAASCVELLSQIAGHARFSASELERQKTFLVNEITNSRYDLAKSGENSLKATFVDGCTLDELINKQINSIRSITLQQIEAYYQRWYVPQNQCLYVFGKAPDDIVDIIKQQFGCRPNMPAPERGVNKLNHQKLLMLKHDVPAFYLQFCFVQPRVAASATKNLDYLRKKAVYGRLGEILGTSKDAQVTVSMDEDAPFFRCPVFELRMMMALDLYADERQLSDFVDDVTKKLDDIIHNGVQTHIEQLTIEKQKELQQQALTNIRDYKVLDTHSCIKANFIHSKPLVKEEPTYQYFKHEVSEQDIQDCCKELFKNYDLRIVCTTPYGYPDADIKAKLESMIYHLSTPPN